MNTTIVSNTINRETVGAAIRQLRIAHRHNARKVNALNKAEARLYSTLWQWDSSRTALMVESATKTGLVTYQVQHGQCECTAAAHGKPCWHLEAWEILVTAETQRPRRSPEDYARIMAEAAELA